MNEIIGEIIKEEVRRSGLTQDQFAERMNMSLRTLANLFNKEHPPHDQLIKASKVLQRDFVRDYLEYLYDTNPEVRNLHVEEDRGVYIKPATKEHEITLQINVQGRVEKIETEFASFLRAVRKEAEDRGLSLG